MLIQLLLAAAQHLEIQLTATMVHRIHNQVIPLTALTVVHLPAQEIRHTTLTVAHLLNQETQHTILMARVPLVRAIPLMAQMVQAALVLAIQCIAINKWMTIFNRRPHTSINKGEACEITYYSVTNNHNCYS